jgi:hypothetical protein
VAAIAFKLLPPQKAAALDQLLRDSDVERGFVDAASYADEVIRDQDHGGDFDTWHYVNWPLNKDGFTSYCTATCIMKAIDRKIKKAANSSNSETKALALSWVIHLIGDLHQPLHVSNHADKGGTRLHMTYRGETRCGNVPNLRLHKAWDSCLVFELEDGRDWQELADDLRGSLTTWRATSPIAASWRALTYRTNISAPPLRPSRTSF